MIGVSIVICCYNSASRLPETLKHISCQKVSKEIDWEVIVVNNASLDDTKEVAALTWEQLNCPVGFCIVDEPVAGLSAARDRGLAVSAYEYLIFCDDDNWLDKEYVQLSFDIMQSDKEIGALGGQFEAAFEIDPPDWFPYFAPNYTVGKQAPEHGDITCTKSYVSGAGAVYRRSVMLFLKENGFESLLTDRKGNSLSTGGDVEIGYAIRMAGYKIWYDDRLKLTHFIPKERLTIDYVERLYKGYLESVPVHLAYEQNFYSRSSLKKSWKWLLMIRIYLAIKMHISRNLDYPEKPSWITRFKRRFEMNMIRSLLNKRVTYKANLNKIKYSNWNKTGNVFL